MNSLQVIAPANVTELSECANITPLAPFSSEILSFIAALSHHLLNDREVKPHPELVALGFWLRDSTMQKFANEQSKALRKALGVVVHFTPANVDTMFIYSWVCSLLMGNNNIVRLASAETAAKNSLINALNVLFARQQFSEIAKRNVFVSYPRESSLSAELSLLADARVIWGGDASVTAIRSLAIKPRCRDVSFADRYSAALINGDALHNAEQINKLAQLLWRDTKPYAQQACSSPRVIFWLGDTRQQTALFAQLNQLADQQNSEVQTLNNHLVVSQLIQSSGLASQALLLEHICALPVAQIKAEFLEWHLGNSLYLIKYIEQLDELAALIDTKLQTLSYWQVDKSALLKLVAQPSIQGVDRIVPVGQALDFSPVWDGFDLFTLLSRSILCL